MKNVIAFIMLTGLLFSLPIETSAQENKKILGDWSFNAPNAGYGYQTGTISFSEQEAEIKGLVKFTDGNEINLNDIVFDANELSFSLYVEGELIKVKMILETEKLSGTVTTSEGDLSITAER